MKLRIVALYPAEIIELKGQPGVITRKRRGGPWTQIECDVDEQAAGSFARPQHPVAGHVGAPIYRAQLELQKEVNGTLALVALAMQPDDRRGAPDPEQRILAPIFNNGSRLIFDFESAEILFIAPSGEVEIRAVAVDKHTGQVTTQTRYQFPNSYVNLIGRAAAYLAGTVRLVSRAARAGACATSLVA